MIKQTINTMRPSSLPKLAVCPSYQNSPFVAGAAAQRGTIMDEAYRFTLMGRMIPQCQCGRYFGKEQGCTCLPMAKIDLADPLDVLDERIAALGESFGTALDPGRENVEWAVTYTRLLAGDDEIIADEDDLFVEVEECDSAGGTMDADIPKLSHGIDLKSGQVRGYMQQMAAYALGRMRADFLDEYTMTLLFCDQRIAVKHVFKFDDAKRILTDIRESVYCGSPAKVVNEYCSWCGAYERCSARKELATRVSSHMNVQERWDIIRQDPEELAAFMDGVSELEAFRDQAKGDAKAFLEREVDVPGYSLVNGRKNASLPAENLKAWCQANGVTLDQFIQVTGDLSKSKHAELGKVVGADTAQTNYAVSQSPSHIKKKLKKKEAAAK